MRWDGMLWDFFHLAPENKKLSRFMKWDISERKICQIAFTKIYPTIFGIFSNGFRHSVQEGNVHVSVEQIFEIIFVHKWIESAFTGGKRASGPFVKKIYRL